MLKRPVLNLEYDLSEEHSPLGEDAMLRKEHGEATVGDAPTAESFRRKAEAMAAGADRHVLVAEEAPPPKPAPKLSSSDILRAIVYGGTLAAPPPGAAYFRRRK